MNVYDRGTTRVSSDAARKFAPEIAALACRGYITTAFGLTDTRDWRVTARGAAAVESEFAEWSRA